jgi:hypothetical protein
MPFISSTGLIFAPNCVTFETLTWYIGSVKIGSVKDEV